VRFERLSSKANQKATHMQDNHEYQENEPISDFSQIPVSPLEKLLNEAVAFANFELSVHWNSCVGLFKAEMGDKFIDSDEFWDDFLNSDAVRRMNQYNTIETQERIFVDLFWWPLSMNKDMTMMAGLSQVAHQYNMTLVTSKRKIKQKEINHGIFVLQIFKIDDERLKDKFLPTIAELTKQFGL